MALSTSTFSNAGGAVSDLFASVGNKYRAQGDEFERKNYLLAADLSDENARFTETSTQIKTMQADRELSKSLGQTRADLAGAGFAESGSSLDILRDSAAQGALAHAVASEQGLITQAGYKEQGQSYRNMADAAQVAIDAENTASLGNMFTSFAKIGASVASLAVA